MTPTSNLSASTASSPPAPWLRYALWAVQVLLGLAFAAAGAMKSTQPIAELAKSLPWAAAVPEALVRFIGVSELLGGVGLVLPSALRVKPGLTALAGAGLVLVMVLAAAFHASRGELGALPVNAVMGALAGFVAWGRWKAAPIAPRG